MAKNKSKLSGRNKYKLTIIKRLAEKDIQKLAVGYTSSNPSKKDKRTQAITSGDKKRTLAAFEYVAKGYIENNPSLTASEIFEKIERTSQFNRDYKSDVGKENFFKESRKFGFNFQRRSLDWDKEAKMYKITRGVNAGRYLKIVHNPGQEPSIEIIMI